MKYSYKTLFSITLAISLIASGILYPLLTGLAQQASSDAVSDREAQLRAELEQVLKEIDDQQKILADEKQKGASIERDITILDAKIKEAQLNIRAKEIAIQNLGKDINQKTQTISVLSNKIDDNKESLAQLIRKTNEADSYTVTDIVLSDKNLSDFFADMDAYDSIKQSIQVALGSIKETKIATEDARQKLDTKRLGEIDAKVTIEGEKAKIVANEKEKARLLSLSKEQQKNYQGEISKRMAKAASIRAALFNLRDTAAINFGQALEYATLASQKTGIRPAFLLAILTQESNLGKNVGSCYLKDTNTGAGVGVNTGNPISKVMSPTRDVPVFIALMTQVGRDPFATKVSCPQSVGWGGAMGPAQFIPSTWQLMADDIGALVGKPVPDPWDPKDAFMASALYLTNLGAGTASYSAERNAACRYYSGKACSAGTGATYGDQVMAKANTIQTTMIDQLQGV
jgi:membrane-bound lytic murein transglycosylase B